MRQFHATVAMGEMSPAPKLFPNAIGTIHLEQPQEPPCLTPHLDVARPSFLPPIRPGIVVKAVQAGD